MIDGLSDIPDSHSPTPHEARLTGQRGRFILPNMINLPLTPQIKEFLDTPHEARDYAAGAELLGRVSRNRVLYSNVSRNPRASAKAIEYHLGKIYTQRLQTTTREEVAVMMQECSRISEAHGLRHEASKKSEFQRGKRADHDELPEEIQRLWVENADIRQRMRDCHTHLRLITSGNSTCPDSDRYPWAKQLIAYNRLYRDNWNRYDHYIKGTNPLETKTEVDPRTASRNAAKLANMLLGRYAASPDAKTADRIREAYAKVISPTENLTEKMRRAKLL